MGSYSQKELDDALKYISSTISRCEKMQFKFAQGTSQHSLLINRIKALEISKSLIENDSNVEMYNQMDLEKSLPPVISIINKSEKAQRKYAEGTVQYRRYVPIIKAMNISKIYIENAISELKR